MGFELGTVVLVVVGLLFAVGVCYSVIYLSFLKKAGPNEVIVVSGRGKVRFITGGADMVVPLFHTWNHLSLEVMTLDVTTPEVYTMQGVPVIVDGVAQIKIKKDTVSLHAAAERFLGMQPKQVAKIALETVQGHLRAILGTLSVEDIYKNRDEFARKVQEISAGDLANMGLGIDSFTIRDIRDQHGYLESLGKPQIAEVKKTAAIAEAVARKEAAIAEAEADRETRERQSEAEKLAREAEAKRDASVAEAEAEKERREKEADAGSRRAAEIAKFQAEEAIAEQQAMANEKRADAEMAYELQKKGMEIRIQEQEIVRREKQLDADIKRQADAQRYEIETLAEAKRKRVEIEAAAEQNRLVTLAEGEKAQGFAAAEIAARQGQAEAEAERARGLAEAEIQQAQGLAEADIKKAQGLAEALTMEKRAAAWQQYNEAALLQILAPILPELAKAVAEPLARIDSITMVNTGEGGQTGVSRLTKEVADVIAQVPPVLESLTGFNVKSLLDKVRSEGGPEAEAAALAVMDSLATEPAGETDVVADPQIPANPTADSSSLESPAAG